jgi:hypothetical protein
MYRRMGECCLYVHQANEANSREAGVRMSALVARIDCVEIELLSNAERHQLERSFIS